MIPALSQIHHVRVEFAPNAGNVVAFVVKDDQAEAIRVDGMTFEK